MIEVQIGQRWISEAEPDLGLGLVVQEDTRTVTILFPSADEQRTYTRREAPLSRVRFEIGDSIRSHDGEQITVLDIEDNDGVLIYLGQNTQGDMSAVLETRLDHRLQLTRALDRITAGMIDSHRFFDLRHSAHIWQSQIARSKVAGLLGGRIDLISHQLYIAHEVGQRDAPRVLLADEVGLGKTIEAGMIMHKQWLNGRARRMLVVVPDALVHQWFVEMWRRFNLRFSIFDEERCVEVDTDNPFHSEQLVLVSMSFLRDHPERHQQAIDGEWDLLVVDEAHHLHWSPEGQDMEYGLVEALSRHASGVLLLTATPEQLGREGHFGRLRLLDPHRFHDLNAFLEEENRYQPVAEAARILIENAPMDDTAQAILHEQLGDDPDLEALINPPDTANTVVEDAETPTVDHREQVLARLIDRHGTGRVLFRNTRSAMANFPVRQLQLHPLDKPDHYAMEGSLQDQICPELSLLESGQDWTGQDPRVDWLAELLSELNPLKTLVICAHAETAITLSEALKTRFGILTGTFHEDLDMVARDRAAAWFADPEDGARALICSEIGSEGRNFQFAHDLVLFDLPLNPDLLEQRIGRLDRIGQTQDIQIHVPYFIGTASEGLMRWYHQGLDAFETTCPDGVTVFEQLREQLEQAISNQAISDQNSAALNALIATTRDTHQTLVQAVSEGRDRLLEMHSHRPDQADELINDISQLDHSGDLANFLNNVFDAFGVDNEELNAHTWLAKPSDHMMVDAFPGLPEDGIHYTLHRATALAQEDVQFLTWEHPLVRGAMELLQGSGIGNSSLTVLRDGKLKPGTLLLEALFLADCPGAARLNLQRFLPEPFLRVLVDPSGRDLAPRVPRERLKTRDMSRDRATAGKLLRGQADQIKKIYSKAEEHGEQHLETLLQQAASQAIAEFDAEHQRLTELQKVNASVRDEEIRALELHKALTLEALSEGTLRLDSLHLIVATQ